jgi:hypothetical protein
VAYLTGGEAADRLAERFGVTASPSEGDLAVASSIVDAFGPFVGTLYEWDQPHAFPRSETLAGDTEGEVPESVLDAVALFAADLADSSEDVGGGAPVQSYTVGEMTYQFVTGGSRSPRKSKAAMLLSSYSRRTGVVV